MSDRDDKRLREAAWTMSHILDAMEVNEVPIDSCLLAGEIARDTGRALGYRARMFPVRVRVRHEDGRVGREIGYDDLSPQAVAEDRYHGHVLCLWDDKVALDPTAPQFDPAIAKPGKPGTRSRVRAEAIPSLAFPIGREFAKRQAPVVLPLESGWTLSYEPFDDHGDWAKPSAGNDTDTRLSIRESGRMIAERVRRRR